MNKCLAPLLFLSTSCAFAIDIASPLTNAAPKLSVTWDRAQGASPKRCGRVYLPHTVETASSCLATLSCDQRHVTFTIKNSGGTATTITTNFQTILADNNAWLQSNQNTCSNTSLAADQLCNISASVQDGGACNMDHTMTFTVSGQNANTLSITIENQA